MDAEGHVPDQLLPCQPCRHSFQDGPSSPGPSRSSRRKMLVVLAHTFSFCPRCFACVLSNPPPPPPPPLPPPLQLVRIRAARDKLLSLEVAATSEASAHLSEREREQLEAVLQSLYEDAPDCGKVCAKAASGGGVALRAAHRAWVQSASPMGLACWGWGRRPASCG